MKETQEASPPVLSSNWVIFLLLLYSRAFATRVERCLSTVKKNA